MEKILVGVSGASGVVLAYLATRQLLQLGFIVDLVLSTRAIQTASYELGKNLSTGKQWLATFPDNLADRLTVWSNKNFYAPFASGSSLYYGMLVIPCSMATLAAISMGISDNLLRRAADVMLKERGHLVIVPRECPLSPIHLEHMLKVSQLGGVIVPPTPAWYTHPKTIEEVNLTIVGRCLDALKISNTLYPRWEGAKC